ncbi:MAG: RNA polymerase factor sigma-54 [Wenzhouxiangellaceae bacterium]
MALQTGLKLKLGQKLKLAPQLRQALALLQLNRLELREHIEQALLDNPLLELDHDDGSGDAAEADLDSDVEQDRDEAFEALDFEQEDYGWDDLPDGFSAVTDAPDYDRFIADPAGDSLQQHLLWQVNLSRFTETDEAIARAIVYALDEDGYLRDDLQAIRAALAPEYLVSADEVEVVLRRVQHFEPVGVAARSTQECLLIQLGALPIDTPGRGVAEALLQHHLDEIAQADTALLARRSGFPQADVDRALALIRKLDPRPGRRFGSEDRDYIVPDAHVYHDGERWRVMLNRRNEPGLRISRLCQRMMAATRGADRDYLREKLQEAKWLISSLELRNHTLLRVIHAIVERQTGFLEHGEIALAPLLQKEIAEALGVHESTISRATTGKYLHTPRGTFELKRFFSVAVPTRDGRAVSATSVKARLAALIRAEDPDSPWSDQALAEHLAADGILLARRTVAKYREELGIPSSTRRRRARPVA